MGPRAVANVDKVSGNTAKVTWTVTNKTGQVRSAILVVVKNPGTADSSNIGTNIYENVAVDAAQKMEMIIPAASLSVGVNTFSAFFWDQVGIAGMVRVANVGFTVTVSGWDLGTLTVA